ncbi:hypothetical protein ACP4OV_018329 [Aristida adscensionis]
MAAVVVFNSLPGGHGLLLAADENQAVGVGVRVRVRIHSIVGGHAGAALQLLRGRRVINKRPLTRLARAHSCLLLLHASVLPALVADPTSIPWRLELQRIQMELRRLGERAGGSFARRVTALLVKLRNHVVDLESGRRSVHAITARGERLRTTISSFVTETVTIALE